MRKFSEQFIESEINKIDELKRKLDEFTPILYHYNNHALPNHIKKEVEEYIEHRKNNSYINGFWRGWTLAMGSKND